MLDVGIGVRGRRTRRTTCPGDKNVAQQRGIAVNKGVKHRRSK